MTKEERLQYFRDKILIENNLNFEKEINGTIYRVNAYFNDNSQESILEKVNRMIKNS
ncbi:MAG: transposon-encoded TnpW family protein [Clostridia bacterium]|nr:transposon-encoded TnpW family protein [Clostridia bacterium]